MKICHYNNHQAGVVVGNKVVNIGENLIKAGLARQGYTMLEIIDALANNPKAMQIAKDAESSTSGEDLLSVKLLAPITNPGSLWAAAANYYAHRAEMVDRMGSANKEIKNKDDLMAEFFLKPTSSIIGPGDAIILPKISKLVDFECELCAVIGKTRAQSERGAIARSRIRLHDLLGHQPARSVGQGHAQHAQHPQRLRHLQRAGPMDRHARRDRRAAESFDQSDAERQGSDGRAHQRHDLRPARAHPVSVGLFDPAPRRFDHHRHAGGREQAQARRSSARHASRKSAAWSCTSKPTNSSPTRNFIDARSAQSQSARSHAARPGAEPGPSARTPSPVASRHRPSRSGFLEIMDESRRCCAKCSRRRTR